MGNGIIGSPVKHNNSKIKTLNLPNQLMITILQDDASYLLYFSVHYEINHLVLSSYSNFI